MKGSSTVETTMKPATADTLRILRRRLFQRGDNIEELKRVLDDLISALLKDAGQQNLI